MNKNLLLLTGIVLASSTGLMAAVAEEESGTVTEKRRALLDKKDLMTRKHAEIQAKVARMEGENAAPETLAIMYTNSSIFDIKAQLADLYLYVDVLSESNKKRIAEIKALQTQVAALSSKS